MRQNTSKYKLYLNDILRSIRLIEKSLKNKKFEDFIKNNDLIDSNSMRLQIIGESISKLPKEILEKEKDIDWRRLIQTRNIISHAYFSVDERIIWDLIQQDIPKLKKIIKRIQK